MSDKPKSEIKVTDKRIFTAEGEIREEFKEEIRPGDPFISCSMTLITLSSSVCAEAPG